VIDYEILSTVIRTVPLLWHVQKFQFLAKVKATIVLVNRLTACPKTLRWLNCALEKINVAICRDPE
jgi:hypothetical protein